MNFLDPNFPSKNNKGRINCILEPDSEFGGLFLGNFYGAEDIDLLKELKIKAVLNCVKRLEVNYSKDVIEEYHMIPTDDEPDFDIKSYFAESINFIHENRKKHSVYVHCFFGKSRSATIIIAYLMTIKQMKFSEALLYVKSRRSIASPNPGFCEQLEMFEKELETQRIKAF